MTRRLPSAVFAFGCLTLAAILPMTRSDAQARVMICQKGKRAVLRTDQCKAHEVPVTLSLGAVEVGPAPSLSCEVVRAITTIDGRTAPGAYNFTTDPCPDGTMLTGGGFHIRDVPPDPAFLLLGSKRAQDQPDRWQCAFYTPGNMTIGFECYAHCCKVVQGQ